MATYIKTCSNNSNYSLRLELSESNISISNNTSMVNYSLYLDSTYARFEDWNVSYTLYIGNEVSINRTEKLSMPPTRREPLLLVSGSKTVTHDDGGSRSLSVSCSISTSTSQSYLPGSASISTTFILTTIARKSTMYDVSGTIGKSISLRITKRNSGFTHTIRYSFGNASGTIVNKGSSNSINWTPPIALYLQIIGSSSGRGTISIETFNGSDSLGSNSYVLTLNAEKTYNVPSVTNFTYERGSGSSDSNWRSDPNGSDVRIKYTASITSGISGNTTSLVVKLGTTILFSSSNASSGSYTLYKQGIGTITTYTATITVSDTIGSSKSWNLTVATIEVPLDINVNLPGIACGKVAEQPKTLEFAEGWGLKFGSDPMMDFVVEQGTSEIWTYRIWNSGTAECWGQPAKSVASSGTFLGANAYSTNFALPSGLFVSVDSANANPRLGSNYAIPAYIKTTPTSVGVDALSNESGTNDFSANIFVRGRWK